MGFFSRLVGSPSKKVLKTGEVARGGVLALTTTGVRVNDNPVAELKLLVVREGHPPYEVEHREKIPMLLIPRVQPDAILPLRVDPGDPQEVAIDWEAEWPSQDVATLVPGSGADRSALAKSDPLAALAQLDTEQAKQVQAAEEEASAGKYTGKARAMILRYEPVGDVGELTRMKLHLQLREEAGEPWETDYDLVCSDRIKAMIAPGASFDAVYDPSNRGDVDLNFPPA